MWQGPEGSVYAIALLDMCLYPKVTTYFAFICRVTVMLVRRTIYILIIMRVKLFANYSHSLIFQVILSVENKFLKVLDVGI